MFDPGEWRIEAPDGSLFIQENRFQWVHTDRSMIRYIAKKTRVSEDFHHSFVVCIDEGYVEDQKNRGLIRLWEIRNDWDNRVWIYARETASGWNIHYEQRNTGKDLWAYHGAYIFPWGIRFIVELERVGNTYRLRVLSEEDEIILEDSGWIMGVSQVFGWLWLASSIRSRRNNGNWSTGYIENLHTSSPD